MQPIPDPKYVLGTGRISSREPPPGRALIHIGRTRDTPLLMPQHRVPSHPPTISTMLGLAGRRTALARPRCLAPCTSPARAALVSATQCNSTRSREFGSTPAPAAFRPTWMPMRVKTPWIDALTQSHEASAQKSQPVSVKPDQAPKKMSDSYYSAVCIFFPLKDSKLKL